MTDIRRVLVADDDEAIRRLIEYTLQQRGFEPVLVADGSQAIARASDDFLCAVIDLKMPEADGMAVLEHFRTQHPDVPVLIVSAVGQTRDAVAAVKGGAFDYVSKPFEVEELGALVESAAGMGRALQQHRALREAVGRSGPPTGLVAAAAVTRDLLVVVFMWMREELEAAPIRPSPGVTVALTVAVVATIVLGVYPAPLFDLAEASAKTLGMAPRVLMLR